MFKRINGLFYNPVEIGNDCHFVLYFGRLSIYTINYALSHYVPKNTNSYLSVGVVNKG